jgi:ATP-dependent DNA helicase RecG
MDVQDYPELAIREALLNAVVHRDYDYSGSTIINILSDRMEFVSLGGLLKGITLVDIMSGISQPRNFTIASIFYRLELIESYGTGIAKIIESYKGQIVQPDFSSGPASFIVKLFNINELNLISENRTTNYYNMTDEEKVLEMFKTKESITRKEVQNVLQTSAFPANKIINKLINDGKILRIGSARATRYIRIKQIH